MRRPRTLRGRLTALALLAALVAIGILTLVFNLLLRSSLDGDANDRLRSQAAAAATTVHVADGRIRLHEAPEGTTLDRLVWVFDGHHAVEQPPAAPVVQVEAAALAGRSGFRDVPDREERLYALPVLWRGRQVGTIVTAQPLAAYDRTTDLALAGSLGFAVALLLAVFLGARVFIGRALAPVTEMTRLAADWGDRDLGRRFGAVLRPDELGELARTFDGLLDRVATSVRHEQRLSAELSHELRTPLARIVAEVELLQRRERSPEDRRDAYAAIGRSAEEMSTVLETLMSTARAEAGLDHGRADLAAVLRRLEESWEPVLAEDDLELEVRAPSTPLVAGVDPEVVERAVAPLLDNARRHARSRVRLEALRDGQSVAIAVADDGPGLPPEAGERIFEPGVSIAVDDGDHQGAGLGLPLARRLARAAGGDVVVEPGDAGAQLRVVLPVP